MFTYVIQFCLLGITSVSLIWYYSYRSTPTYAKILVTLSFFICFVSFMVLPIDIYENLKQNDQQSHQQHQQQIKQLWKIIFYINFIASWLILPFFQDYQDSGEFTFKRKIKDALKFNIILILIICSAAFVVIIYLILVQKFTFNQIPSVFAMLVNLFGMMLVTLSLGFGLVSLPKKFYSKRNYKKRVNICHRSAEILKNQQQQINEQIYNIKQVLTNSQTIVNNSSQVSYLMNLIDKNFNLNDFRSYDQIPEGLYKKSMSDLHKIIKKSILHYKSCESQLDEIVDELKQITTSFSKNNYKWKRILHNLLFIITSIISLIIYLAQISIFTTNKISVVYWLNYDIQIGYFINCVLLLYIVYVITHTIFRVKVYKVFELRKGHSNAASLFFTSINMSRICYPLCYNYLLLTSVQKTQFQQFIGAVQIPNQIKYVFPILMVILGLFNLFDVYQTILGYLGLGSYAFDQEQANQKSQQGRKILIQRFKQRNYQNLQIQLIQLL